MPTKVKLEYLSPAASDMAEIVKFHIPTAGVPSARTLYAPLATTIGKLSDYPLMGQIHPDPLLAAQGFRKLVLTNTYVAIYKIIDNAVYIYRVVNGKTNYPRLLK